MVRHVARIARLGCGAAFTKLALSVSVDANALIFRLRFFRTDFDATGRSRFGSDGRAGSFNRRSGGRGVIHGAEGSTSIVST